MVKRYSKEEVISFLRNNPIMSAAMCGEERPVSTILLFAVEDNFQLYFATKLDTYKERALRVNRLMSVSIWKNREMEVQMSGSAERVTDENVIDSALDKLAMSVNMVDGFWAPILRMNGEYVIFTMKPDWVRVLDLSSESISESESGFTEFEINS